LSGVISEEDKTDLITNLLACSANDLSQTAKVEACLNSLGASKAAHESVYELFFNQSQSLLKQQLFDDSI
jgi:hypothetical protein